MNVPTPITGHCLCGAVSYEIDAQPQAVILCHCEDCRRQSGGSYSTNLVVESSAMTLEGAELKTYETTGEDSGKPRQRQFCGRCGSPLVTLADELPGVTILKAGTLDDPSWLTPTMEIYAGSAHPWVHDADAPERTRFERGLPSG